MNQNPQPAVVKVAQSLKSDIVEFKSWLHYLFIYLFVYLLTVDRSPAVSSQWWNPKGSQNIRKPINDVNTGQFPPGTQSMGRSGER